MICEFKFITHVQFEVELFGTQVYAALLTVKHDNRKIAKEAFTIRVNSVDKNKANQNILNIYEPIDVKRNS